MLGTGAPAPAQNRGAAATEPIVQTMPFYRFYDPVNGGHFWTTNPAEMTKACARCRKEGPACHLITTAGTPGSMPYYRFYDPVGGGHFWSADPEWQQKACKRCRKEGIAGWVLHKDVVASAVPFNRYYNESSGKHFWTVNDSEARNACGTCRLEGPAGFVFTEPRDILHQSYWRGGKGRSRKVPIVGGRILWDQASPWSQPITTAKLPGKGPLQSLSSYWHGGALHQSIWRGNQGWYRTVPAENGAVDWKRASAWKRSVQVSALPGHGDMQNNADYIVGNTLYQGYWRSNQGWSRTVPIRNGKVDWQAASEWSGPLDAAKLPGAGDMRSLDSLVIGDTLHQAFWRGSQGWSRTVPVRNGAPEWGNASKWSGPLAPNAVPGKGALQAQVGFVVPPSVGLRK